MASNEPAGCLLETDPRGVAQLTLNRPEVHNAFDDRLIAELTSALRHIGQDSSIRVLVLAAAGKSFSAGADLRWMERVAAQSQEENHRDARRLAELMRLLDHLSKPTVAKVQGAAVGGGIGLLACCDIAVASTAAWFAFSEVRLGLIPAVIGPYVLPSIGRRNTRRYFLTAERFDVEEARRIGLVHEAVEPSSLDARVEEFAARLLQAGPQACREAKRLVSDLADRPPGEVAGELTAGRFAAIRSTPEAKEGVAAFLEKRKPEWRP